MRVIVNKPSGFVKRSPFRQVGVDALTRQYDDEYDEYE
jgi:hypothetical protein